MVRFDTSGLEKLQRELTQASEALKSLDGEIATLKFNGSDSVEIHRAIHRMEVAIDQRLAPYSSNQFVGALSEKMKIHFRERILELAGARRNASVSQLATSEEVMNPVVEKKRKQRFDFMKALYECTDGRERALVKQDEIGTELGFSREETDLTVEYLKGEGLLKRVVMGGIIGISHLGVVEVETALQKPDQPTEHFPAVHNTITIHSMTNSVIQQGSSGATQSVTFNQSSKESIERFVAALKDQMKDLGLSTDVEAEARAELATVEAQLSSPKPKSAIIAGSLSFLIGVVEKVTASLLTPEIHATLPAVQAFLAQHL